MTLDPRQKEREALNTSLLELHDSLAEGRYNILKEAWYEEALVRMALDVVDALRYLISHLVVSATPVPVREPSPDTSDNGIHPETLVACFSQATMAQSVVDFTATEVNSLRPLMAVVDNTLQSPLWTLVCKEVKTALGDTLANMRLGVGFVLCVCDANLLTPSVVIECSKRLKLHQTQLGVFVADCRAVLDKELGSGLVSASPAVALKESLSFSALLAKQADPRILGHVALLAHTEQMSGSQVELLNDHFAEPIVGIMYLHQALTRRFDGVRQVCQKIHNGQSSLLLVGQMIDLQRNQLAPFLHTSSDTGASLILNGEQTAAMLSSAEGILPKVHPESRLGREAFASVIEQLLVCCSRATRAERALRAFNEELAVLNRKAQRHLKLVDQLGGLTASPGILGKKLLALTQALAEVTNLIFAEGPALVDLEMELHKLCYHPATTGAKSEQKQSLEDEEKLAKGPKTSTPREILLSWMNAKTKEAVLEDCSLFYESEHCTALKASISQVGNLCTNTRRLCVNMCSSERGLLAALHTAQGYMDELQTIERQTTDEALQNLRHDAAMALLPPTGTHATPKGLINLVNAMERTMSQSPDFPGLGDDLHFSSQILREVIEQYSTTEQNINKMSSAFSDLASVNLKEVSECGYTLTVHTLTVTGLGKALYLSQEQVDAMLTTTRQVFRPDG